MDYFGYQRQKLAQDGHDWAVFRLPDGSIQIDLGRAGLILAEEAFRLLTDFVAMALTLSLKETITATTPPQRVVCYCQQTNAVMLGIEQTILRFRPHEFVRFARLCQQTVVVLGPAQIRYIPSPHVSRN